jgi:hypothetical protein
LIPISYGVGGVSFGFFVDEAGEGECFDGEFVEGGTVFVECVFLWDGEGVNLGLPGVIVAPSGGDCEVIRGKRDGKGVGCDEDSSLVVACSGKALMVKVNIPLVSRPSDEH